MAIARAGDLEILYELSGEGPTVLFISGMTLDHSIWNAFQVPAFTAAGFRCLVFDNRDVGRTGESPTGAYAIAQLVADTVGLLDHLDIDSPHVIGFSLGGMVAQELALAFPQRVRSLTLLATYAKPDAYTTAVMEFLKSVKQSLPGEASDRAMGLQVFSHRFFGNPEAVRMWMERVRANPYPQSAAAFVRQTDAAIAHDTLSRLSRIKAPTHVIVGEEDILTPPRYAKVLAGNIPGAQLSQMPGVAHAVPAEGSEQFNRLALDFLRRH